MSVFILSCAAGPRQEVVLEPKVLSGSILSLRLLNSAGPGLGEGIALVDPATVEVNNRGDIYISDKAANTIYKLSPNLELLGREGGMGVTGGSFNRPLGLASDAALNLYVADSGNRRVVVLDRDMHFIRSIAFYNDDKGEEVRFNLPGDVSIDNQGNLWVADDTRALKLDLFQTLLFEVSEGAPIFAIIGRIPSLDASRAGQVALADIGSNKILSITIFGSRIGDFNVQSPASVAWLGNEIWVAHENSGRISAYDGEGNQTFAYFGDEPGFRPAWLAFTPDGRLAAVDRGARKVKIFEIIRRQG